MAFNEHLLAKARAAAKAEGDRIRASMQPAPVVQSFAPIKPRARKTQVRVAPVQSIRQPSREPVNPDVVPACVSTDKNRPLWMNTHVLDPGCGLHSGVESTPEAPEITIAKLIAKQMLLRVEDNLLNHVLSSDGPTGHLPATSDLTLERHLDHSPASRYGIDEAPGRKAMAVLRALIPNRAKRLLVTDYISKLLIMTREACINVDGLQEELLKHLDMESLYHAIDYHCETSQVVMDLTVDEMVLEFEKLSHGDRCDFLARVERVRPLHPACF